MLPLFVFAGLLAGCNSAPDESFISSISVELTAQAVTPSTTSTPPAITGRIWQQSLPSGLTVCRGRMEAGALVLLDVSRGTVTFAHGDYGDEYGLLATTQAAMGDHDFLVYAGYENCLFHQVAVRSVSDDVVWLPVYDVGAAGLWSGVPTKTDNDDLWLVGGDGEAGSWEMRLVADPDKMLKDDGEMISLCGEPGFIMTVTGIGPFQGIGEWSGHCP